MAVRYFDPSKDDGGYFPGVPKRDLEQADWDRLDARQRRNVDAHPMYRKTALRGDAKKEAEQAVADVIGPAEKESD